MARKVKAHSAATHSLFTPLLSGLFSLAVVWLRNAVYTHNAASVIDTAECPTSDTLAVLRSNAESTSTEFAIAKRANDYFLKNPGYMSNVDVVDRLPFLVFNSFDLFDRGAWANSFDSDRYREEAYGCLQNHACQTQLAADPLLIFRNRAKRAESTYQQAYKDADPDSRVVSVIHTPAKLVPNV